MSKDFLQGVADEYDVIVIGSGLAGLTGANMLARAGHRVLLLEQHYKLGGMATWFNRPRRAHLRHLAARLSGRHDQKLPPLLDARNRRLDRAAEAHPLRQPDVLADDDVQTARISRGC